MSPDFNLLNPPRLSEISHFIVESLVGVPVLLPFFRFEWRGETTWTIGQNIRRGLKSSRSVRLRLPRGKHVFEVQLYAKDESPIRGFTISRPKTFTRSAHNSFVFIGFNPSSVVNIDIVRYENDRLAKVPENYSQFLDTRVPRPLRGKII